MLSKTKSTEEFKDLTAIKIQIQILVFLISELEKEVWEKKFLD